MQNNLPLIIVSVLGHLKGGGALTSSTSNFLHGGGIDVFWNDHLIKKVCIFKNAEQQLLNILKA